ncbi:hypothetical protein DIPPA_16677 [Diplonema papillatum]|nr:hypothetical protein DIPPA_16677 [Diplonema papillatum]
MGDTVRISKSLSYILRHGAVKEGYAMQPDGFVLVDQIREIGPRMLRDLSDADFLHVVETNDKKRFKAKTVDGRLWLAANQGHNASLNLDEAEYLTPIASAAAAPVAVHGTYKKALASIMANGLSRMSRQHIHFAPGLPRTDGVISGMRATAEVLVYLDVEKCLANGVKLFKSDNGVILSPGDESGHIKPEFFSKVEQR